MKTIKVLIIVNLVLFSATFYSCKKDEKKDEIIKPVVSAIQPMSGPKGTAVTITGSNFSSDITQVSVKVNGKSAQVSSVTPNVINIIIPPKAGTGTVVVYVNGESGNGPVFNFIYTVLVSAFCGNGTAGFMDGSAANAQFNSPRGLAVDAFDNLYVADELNHRIRRIATNGQVTTFTGNGISGFADGNPSTAKFNHPYDIVYDKIYGNYYVADKLNHCIRRISSLGNVTTSAGVAGTAGYVNGAGTSARLNNPTGVEVSGEAPEIFIADAGNHAIRKLDEFNVLSTLAGTNSAGLTNGSGIDARFNAPYDIAKDSATGYLYVSETGNHDVRRISTSGQVTTFAGTGAAGFANGSGLFAQFNTPTALSVYNGEIFLCDKNNNRIREINSVKEVSTIAGTGSTGTLNGVGSTATFTSPSGIVRDSNGNYYIADTGNHLIRKIVVD
jgi:uncharacterized protein (TIGR03437 family)